MSDIAEVLRGLPYFSDLPQGLLDQVCRESESIHVDAETTIIEEDSLSEDMFVIVEGELRVTKQGTDREVVLATLGPGEVVGEIALLDNAPRTASVTTISPSSLIRIPANAFEDLIEDSRVVRRMFRTVTSRLRGIEDTLRHEERMAALGRMAAQLMHELNNPAAAVGRSMARAEDVYVALGDATVLLSGIGELLARPIPVPEKPQFTDPLTRSSLEDGVATWLEELGVGDAWEIAPALVADGWDIELLQDTTEGLDSETTTKFMRWLGLRVLASQLINEVRIAAGRISELVRVVKNYSYLDQGPVQSDRSHRRDQGHPDLAQAQVAGHRDRGRHRTGTAVDRSVGARSQSGLDQSHRQCRRRDGRFGDLDDRGGTRGRRGGGPHLGHRPGDRSRGPTEDLRPVFHHQGARARNGSGASHRAHARHPDRC